MRLAEAALPHQHERIVLLPRSLEGRPRGAHRHLIRRTDREGRERERRGRPGRRRAPLAHLGPAFLRPPQPPGTPEPPFSPALRTPLGPLPPERLEPPPGSPD